MCDDVAQMLREMVDDHLCINGIKFEVWLDDGLKRDGPWNTHHCSKKKINSFLKHELAVQEYDTRMVRQYLDATDDDEVWCRSVCYKVIPHLVGEDTR